MNDQGYTYLASGCSDCRVYKGDKAIRPAFIITTRHGHRYWTCPMCEGSYGEVEPQPQAVTEDARDGERLDWLQNNEHSGLRIEYEGPHVGYSISTWDDTLLGGGNTIREAVDNAIADTVRRAQTSNGKGAE